MGSSMLEKICCVLATHQTQNLTTVRSVSRQSIICPRSQLLFRNFEGQYKLDVGLSDCEKLIGVEVRIARDKLSLKRLGILRKSVYDCNHDCRVPKWDEILTAIDRLYVIEYGIAERGGRIDKVLKDWGI
jgi:hypothetical protein